MLKLGLEIKIETAQTADGWQATLLQSGGTAFIDATEGGAVRRTIIHALGAIMMRMNSLSDDQIRALFPERPMVEAVKPKIEVFKH